MTEQPVVPLSALLAVARRTLLRAVHLSLAEAGMADLPRRGSYVVTMLAQGASWDEVADDLDLTRSQSSALAAQLRQAEYLTVDDRLTSRGRAAAQECLDAQRRVVQRLADEVGERNVALLRHMLALLGQGS